MSVKVIGTLNTTSLEEAIYSVAYEIYVLNEKGAEQYEQVI